MKNPFSIQSRVKRIYTRPKESVYTYRFFSDLCTGYSFKLGDRNGCKEFYTFEPEDCRLSKLIMEGRFHDQSYRIEKVIDETAYDMLAFGRAYVYIEPYYTKGTDKEQKESNVLSSVNIAVIKGLIKRQSHSDIYFYRLGTGGAIRKMHMKSNQLIAFDIRELGNSKRYFAKKLNQLEKYDITKAPAFKESNHVDGYDFSVHSGKYKLRELKALKDIGWFFGTDGLSDSYILYKTIQTKKLEIRILNYILDHLNCGFESFLGKPGGRLTADVKEIDYDRLWRDYTEGKLTGTELTELLF